MNRIDRKFKELRKDNKKALIVFITAGYPSLSITKKLIFEFAKISVDIIELGVPFSDPMADGPVIQEASQAALKNKVNISKILNLVKKIRRHIDTPICLMTYYNPIFCFGEEAFAKSAYTCGVDGIIIPDLPVEEGKSFIKLANKYKLNVICFISPTTVVKRIKYISSISKGFIYYVSLTGVTGARERLPFDLIHNIKTIKKYTQKPVCVGFGVSKGLQVREIAAFADGVIVGSAIIKKIKDNLGKPDLIQKVCRFVRILRVNC